MAAVAASLTGCGNDSAKFRKAEGEAWHTIYHITYNAPCELDDSIRAVIDSVDLALSFFNPDSELSMLNMAEEKKEAGPMLREVYEISRRVWKLSGGMFDPTVSPAITAWGFGKGHEISPDTITIDNLRPVVGFEKTRLENGVIYKTKPQTEFNFSAIAKGYGVDRVAAMFERNGVFDYLIEIGGEIRAGGHNHNGSDWRIAIDTPVEGHVVGDSAADTISFSGMGMATSGNYRNFHRTENGGLFGHTISPLTLRPVKTDLLSVTVMAPTCAEADALATASMVMGFDRASALLDSLNLPALFIVGSGGNMIITGNNRLRALQKKNGAHETEKASDGNTDSRSDSPYIRVNRPAACQAE